MDGGASEPSNEGNAPPGDWMPQHGAGGGDEPQRTRTAGCGLWEGRKRIGCRLGTLELWMYQVAVDDQLVEHGCELMQLD